MSSQSSAGRVPHRSREPIHVVGYGSSGTSIFCQLLREKLGVGIGTESQFIVAYYDRLAEYGDLKDDRNLRRLIADISHERWFQRNRKFGFVGDPEAIFRDVNRRDYRGVLDAVFSQLAKHLGADRWGDKTPDYVNHLDLLWQLFPDAQYIHVVRDGRDVAHSVMRRYWGPKNIDTAARQWSRQVALVDRFFRQIPSAQQLTVRYEDLLSEPVSVFGRVIEFLQVDDAQGKVLGHIRQTVPQQLDRKNQQKWRGQWSQSDQVRFENIACEQLRCHRYDTIVSEPRTTESGIARCYWRFDNSVRKLMWWDYWKDNIYKGGLRIRRALQRLRIARREADGKG